MDINDFLTINTRLGRTAQRIIDIDFYEALDTDTTTETIMHDIENDPISVIEFLLDIIEEYQAPGK